MTTTKWAKPVPRLVKIPDSSNVIEIGYDLKESRLFVMFTGGTLYAYKNVTPLQVAELLNAPSVGKQFNEGIKSKPEAHPFERIQAAK